MRLVRAVLFVALTGSWALADEAKPADPKPEVTKGKVPYRVVKMLPETGQVLLFDRIRGTHVVAEVGHYLEGYLVDEIDDDEVTLVADSGAQVILTAPLPPRRQAAKKAAAQADGEPAASSPASGPAASDPAPVDPYADPEPPKVAGEGGVRVASAAAATATASPPSRSVSAATAAPIIDSGAPALTDPYGDPGIAAFADAVSAPPDGHGAGSETAAAAPKAPAVAPASKASTKSSEDAFALAAAATGSPAPASTSPPSSTTPSPTAATSTPSGPPPPPLPDFLDTPEVPATASASSPKATPATATIARAELDAALADFSKLAGSFRATFTPDGLRFDAVQEGSLLGKIGLRKGDVVTYVDGKPLRSLDDAANLYARAGSVRATTLQVVRDGKLVTLQVAIR